MQFDEAWASQLTVNFPVIMPPRAPRSLVIYVLSLFLSRCRASVSEKIVFEVLTDLDHQNGIPRSNVLSTSRKPIRVSSGKVTLQIALPWMVKLPFWVNRANTGILNFSKASRGFVSRGSLASSPRPLKRAWKLIQVCANLQIR